ncbi:MAG: prepilin-type N-terminal cleavage/methylation domain-containing protein [Candidatus Scalindua rubra]|uniref:FecR protein domain-containing protein n=1 Tax=Candidatus Scalindua brodae TaxID=237368 RepID=A0A0B0EH39_9BACT|nr:MAG: hypothetical protein SCABRO_02395 [Candidatus Scalindua brodae]MBZ0110319.1 prepilin-type N-terminal cleavage/methylation domain-containing protein [Candidatus Scalindua rubra]
MWKLYYKHRNSGFTLIELLVTISIIGILGGIGVVTVGKIKGTKNQATCISNLRGISQGLQSYYNDFRAFPDDGYPDDPNDTMPLSTELAGYITTESTFICPTDNDPTSISDFASYDPYYVARKGSYGENELAIGCPRHRGAKSSTSAFSTGATEITKIGAVQVNGQEIPPDGTTAQRTISSVNDVMTFADGSTVTITNASGVDYSCFLVQSVRLADGTLYSIIKVQDEGDIDVQVTSGSKFEIVTPSAIVGVRGTQFTVTTTNLGFTTDVVLTTGTVVLQNRDTGKTATLTEGGTTTGTVDVPMHTHMHYHVDGTYHSHSHPSQNNAHHGNPAAARKAAAASTTASEDNDGDGYSENEGDCDDTNAAVYPGAADTPDNGIDEDCDGQDATVSNDVDADGYTVAQGDCDDNDASVNPGETETAYNGIDDDCNPSTPDDDIDGDTYLVATDCDDSNPAVNPGALEILDNGKDDDCDPNTVDSSVEQALLDMINDPEVDVNDLEDALTAASPLSDVVLYALIDKEIMNSNDYEQILTLNSPLSDNILNKMINQDIMNNGSYSDVLELNSPLSDAVLTTMINQGTILSSNNYDTILALNSPLTDSVLITMINKGTIMNSGSYSSVLTPHNPLSEPVLDAMVTIGTIMNSSTYRDILISNSPLPLSILTKVNLGTPPLDPLDLIAVLAAQL